MKMKKVKQILRIKPKTIAVIPKLVRVYISDSKQTFQMTEDKLEQWLAESSIFFSKAGHMSLNDILTLADLNNYIEGDYMFWDDSNPYEGFTISSPLNRSIKYLNFVRPPIDISEIATLSS